MHSTGGAARAALIPAHEAAGADRPLLTFYDDATGERVALTAAAFGGWVSRTASMLRDGCQLRAGDRAAVLLPPHWQTAAALLGAWSIGVTVSFRSWATAGLTPPSGDTQSGMDAVFVARNRLDSWLETVPDARHKFVLGLAANGAAMDVVPDGYRDYVAEVNRCPAPPPAFWAVRPSDPASLDSTSYEEWAGVARGIAASLGLGAGDRLLVEVGDHSEPVTWLLTPLSVGASVVLCANLDHSTLDDRIAAEGVTHMRGGPISR